MENFQFNSFNDWGISINYFNLSEIESIFIDTNICTNNNVDEDFFKNLYIEHCWQNLIFSTNPIKVDNEILSKNPNICFELAKSIKYYNEKLNQLINIRKKGENYNQEKWNEALDKLKTLLYSEFKHHIDQIPNVDLPIELKNYIDLCVANNAPIEKEFLKSYKGIPGNILNNYISNSKRSYKKKSNQQ